MDRKIKKYFIGRPSQDGAGVKLYRTFGYYEIPEYDPFLMMDFFDSTNPDEYIKGFPWHPHRGIETVTYLISGRIEHQDSLGNKGVIGDGDCQWMTAGSGILHQEMPKASSRMLGVQIWLNLHKKDKMTSPKYGDITKDMIPVYRDDKEAVHIIAGSYKGLIGPMEGGKEIEPTFFDVELNPNEEFVFNIDSSFNAYAFLIEGEANFDVEEEKIISYPNGVLYEDGDTIRINTKDKAARFLLLAGKKINEPVAWGGPIVMNTKEELSLAFKELDEGTFIKK
ncbi:pirin family protein [Proteiniborus sp. MB09-C3]|uniref:pirin family protein n=1 Tax=Proteiniborus sp. MB09-C3 TaxID=3050072 RepID=UPI002555E1EC|nr:pirin family protein [Proteiniborus sp. MB09-C3]WIV13726.1 pirin family protein [Proteiniborus sp. MB09-C3]